MERWYRAQIGKRASQGWRKHRGNSFAQFVALLCQEHISYHTHCSYVRAEPTSGKRFRSISVLTVSKHQYA